MNKTIFIAGGDGFIGWPLSLKLSKLNYNVVILDNLSRRKIDVELGCNSLTPISSIHKRLKTWEEITKKKIIFEYINLDTEYDKLCNLIREYKPSSFIHLAEQRSAPYSMKNNNTRRYTVNNNLNVTNNILNSIIDTDNSIHLIHIGTMGVYGYGIVDNTILPEGYINVKIADKNGDYKDIEILHPSYPGSVYHMTKTQDALFFQFYAKNYNLKITDLHQGIVWGAYTEETSMHKNLINRLDYDSDYGTVLNRFIIQATNNIPLTIYGTGEQTRAFININNSLKCIELSLKSPPVNNKVVIMNQFTEIFTLNKLVNLICNLFPNVEKKYVDNPRKELIKNDLDAKNNKLLNLGLIPINLSNDLIFNLCNTIKEYKNEINLDYVMPISFW